MGAQGFPELAHGVRVGLARVRWVRGGAEPFVEPFSRACISATKYRPYTRLGLRPSYFRLRMLPTLFETTRSSSVPTSLVDAFGCTKSMGENRRDQPRRAIQPPLMVQCNGLEPLSHRRSPWRGLIPGRRSQPLSSRDSRSRRISKATTDVGVGRSPRRLFSAYPKSVLP